MNKLLFFIVTASIIFTNSSFKYSTTSVVTLVGARIKIKNQEPNVVKYKREDCPVCKGKGWYMSGDGIKKIECNYCEEPTAESSIQPRRKTVISRG